MAGGSKVAVLTVVEREGDARSFVVDNVKAKTLKGFIRREVEGTAHVRGIIHKAVAGTEGKRLHYRAPQWLSGRI